MLLQTALEVQAVDLRAARMQTALSLGRHTVIARFGVGMPAVTLSFDLGLFPGATVADVAATDSAVSALRKP